MYGEGPVKFCTGLQNPSGRHYRRIFGTSASRCKTTTDVFATLAGAVQKLVFLGGRVGRIGILLLLFYYISYNTIVYYRETC